MMLTDALRREYRQLFDSCQVKPARAAVVEKQAVTIAGNQPRYAAAGGPLGVPWFAVAAIHAMEASLSFAAHLHNGDPLAARTVHVPPGRPKTGQPPFSWEESTRDAIVYDGLDRWTDWSLPGTLYKLEAFNGWGYRLKHPEVLSPYLWSFSNHYARGKFVADGTWSDTAVSQQCGAAVLLRRLAERGDIAFDRAGDPVVSEQPARPPDTLGPLVVYSETKRSPAAEELQRALNRLPGIFLKVDGIPGARTSAAFKTVTGAYLRGDPRT